MKYSDKYPPGTEEDAQNLPPQTKVMGLHPLMWAVVFVLCAAGVGIYSEMVGFYDIAEDMFEEPHDEHGDTPDSGDHGDTDSKDDEHKSD